MTLPNLREFLQGKHQPQDNDERLALLAISQGQGLYAAVLNRVRRALRTSDFATAETLLMGAADIAQKDPAYLNLLGIIYKAWQQWRLTRKFYGKATGSGWAA